VSETSRFHSVDGVSSEIELRRFVISPYLIAQPHSKRRSVIVIYLPAFVVLHLQHTGHFCRFFIFMPKRHTQYPVYTTINKVLQLLKPAISIYLALSLIEFRPLEPRHRRLLTPW
jgi:hypothetical protein